MSQNTVDAITTIKRIDEYAIIRKVMDELSGYIEVSFQDHLEDADAQKMKKYYELLKKLFREGRIDAKRLERFVLNILHDFVAGMRDRHWPDPVEQVLCVELAILGALLEAEESAENK